MDFPALESILSPSRDETMGVDDAEHSVDYENAPFCRLSSEERDNCIEALFALAMEPPVACLFSFAYVHLVLSPDAQKAFLLRMLGLPLPVLFPALQLLIEQDRFVGAHVVFLHERLADPLATAFQLASKPCLDLVCALFRYRESHLAFDLAWLNQLFPLMPAALSCTPDAAPLVSMLRFLGDDLDGVAAQSLVDALFATLNRPEVRSRHECLEGVLEVVMIHQDVLATNGSLDRFIRSVFQLISLDDLDGDEMIALVLSMYALEPAGDDERLQMTQSVLEAFLALCEMVGDGPMIPKLLEASAPLIDQGGAAMVPVMAVFSEIPSLFPRSISPLAPRMLEKVVPIAFSAESSPRVIYWATACLRSVCSLPHVGKKYGAAVFSAVLAVLIRDPTLLSLRQTFEVCGAAGIVCSVCDGLLDSEQKEEPLGPNLEGRFSSVFAALLDLLDHRGAQLMIGQLHRAVVEEVFPALAMIASVHPAVLNVDRVARYATIVLSLLSAPLTIESATTRGRGLESVSLLVQREETRDLIPLDDIEQLLGRSLFDLFQISQSWPDCWDQDPMAELTVYATMAIARYLPVLGEKSRAVLGLPDDLSLFEFLLGALNVPAIIPFVEDKPFSRERWEMIEGPDGRQFLHDRLANELCVGIGEVFSQCAIHCKVEKTPAILILSAVPFLLRGAVPGEDSTSVECCEEILIELVDHLRGEPPLCEQIVDQLMESFAMLMDTLPEEIMMIPRVANSIDALVLTDDLEPVFRTREDVVRRFLHMCSTATFSLLDEYERLMREGDAQDEELETTAMGIETLVVAIGHAVFTYRVELAPADVFLGLLERLLQQDSLIIRSSVIACCDDTLRQWHGNAARFVHLVAPIAQRWLFPPENAGHDRAAEETEEKRMTCYSVLFAGRVVEEFGPQVVEPRLIKRLVQDCKGLAKRLGHVTKEEDDLLFYTRDNCFSTVGRCLLVDHVFNDVQMRESLSWWVLNCRPEDLCEVDACLKMLVEFCQRRRAFFEGQTRVLGHQMLVYLLGKARVGLEEASVVEAFLKG